VLTPQTPTVSRSQAFDEFGNKCARGGENFKVQILEETPAERAVRKRREARQKAEAARQITTTATTCAVTPDTAAPGDATTAAAAVKETPDTAAAQAGEDKSGAEEKEVTKESLEVKEEKEQKNEEAVEEEGVDSEKEEEDYRNRQPIVDDEAGEEEQQTQWLAYHDDEFWVCEECTLLNSKVRASLCTVVWARARAVVRVLLPQQGSIY
jgi:hypothetical protein